MIDERAQYLIQILDKIGSPLLEATEAGAANPTDDSATAQTIASLLGKVVESSISINQALDLKASDSQDDSLRVALAALSGSLIANQYKLKNKIPESADLNRIQSALRTVLTFADNFTPSPEHIKRLQQLKADGSVVDTHQINIQYIEAFIPVINSINTFPFGQPEQKLIMDVSDRLIKRSAEMRENLMPSISGDHEKLVDLAFLRATSHIYAACHDTETARLTRALDSDANAKISIDPVWENFDTRIAMLETVAKNLMLPVELESAPTTSTAPVAPSTPPTSPPPIAETPAASATPPAQPAAPVSPLTEQPITPPVQPPAEQTPPANAPASTNPMSFFGAPNQDDTPATPAPPPVSPPTEQTTPAPESASSDEEGENGDSSNPMSFFTKKD